MAGRLENKIAVITGAGQGIGRATALMFAQEGAQVAVIDINEQTGSETSAIINDSGGQSLFVHADLTNEESVSDAFRAIDERFDQVHILHNCTGGSTLDDAPVDQLDLSTYRHTMDLDLLTVILCSRQAVPLITASGGGAIINMSSVIAFRGVLHRHAYIAAKGGVASLTRAMAGAYADQGIRVNAIAPGKVVTERTRGRTQKFQFEDYPFSIGVPDDIAAITLFLASDESRMVTGVTLMADGGVTAY